MLDDQTIGMAQARFHPGDLHGLFYLRRCLPAGCLAMSDLPREKGVDAWPYLKYPKACIGCGLCSRACPLDIIVMKSPPKNITDNT